MPPLSVADDHRISPTTSVHTVDTDIEAVHRSILLRTLPPQPRDILRLATATFTDLGEEANKFFDTSSALIE